MPPKPSDDDLDLLTEEERQGLLDDAIVDEGLDDDAGDDEDGGSDAGAGESDDGAAAAATESGDAGSGEPDGGDEADEQSADAGGADAAAAAAADAVAAAAAADTGAAAVAEPEERAASWILPPELGQKIDELDKARDALAEQFDDGELTAKEYREKLKPIEKELDELKDRRTAANVERDLEIRRYKTETVPGFLEAHPEYADPESPLYTMLDQTLRKLQQSSRDPLSPRLLERAHEQIAGQVRKAFGVDVTAPKPKDPNPKPAAPKREIPPTLANVPTSDITDADDGGEFAYLDRLATQDVEKYEAALAKMSDEARERYLAQ